MIKYFALIFLSLKINVFSQEVSIVSTFSEDGYLYKNISDFSDTLTVFKNGNACKVLGYFGKEIYKVKYNGFVGYVDLQYLDINESIMDLYYEFQESERLRIIEEEEKRKAQVQEIEREGEAERIQKELLEMERKKALELIEKKRQDSIASRNEKKQTETITILKKVEVKADESKPIENNSFSNTCNYSMNEFDRIEHIEIVRTIPYTLCENLTVELYKRGKNINVFFNLSEDLGCASYLPGNRSSVKVTLENNQTVLFYHSWDMTCGDFIFKGNLSNSQIKRLKKSPIQSIYLKGTNESRYVSDITYKTFFIEKLNCIE